MSLPRHLLLALAPLLLPACLLGDDELPEITTSSTGGSTSTSTSTSSSTGDTSSSSTGEETTGDSTGDSTGDTSSSSGGDPFCGDGNVDEGEECDDGNAQTKDGCVECSLAYCGDGFVFVNTEECDDGNGSNADGCVEGCKVAKCGDGFVEDGVEECDDGNAIAGDGCEPTCSLTPWSHVGPAVDVPVADLAGWSLCYSGTYGDTASIDEIAAACPGIDLLLGCGPTGGDVLVAAAHAPRAEVLAIDKWGETHTANGSAWWRNLGQWGFAPAGEPVTWGTCDTAGAEGRLCWLANNTSTLTPGWRCGSTSKIYGAPVEGQWSRYVFTR